jgi:hypothetical protein
VGGAGARQRRPDAGQGQRPVDAARQAVLFYLYYDDIAAVRAELSRAGWRWAR